MKQLLLKLTCHLHQWSLDLDHYAYYHWWRWTYPIVSELSAECLRLRFFILNFGRRKEDRHPTFLPPRTYLRRKRPTKEN